MSAHEIKDMLTEPGVVRAPELLLEPAAATNLADRGYLARWRLDPGRWALLTIDLPYSYEYAPRSSGDALLGADDVDVERAMTGSRSGRLEYM